MPQSKFGRRRPKYTPPKVCKKSPRGGNFPPTSTTCPPAIQLLATILWPRTYKNRIGAGVTTLTISRQGQPGCSYEGTATTPKNEPYFLHVDFDPLGTTSGITLLLGQFGPPQDSWIIQPTPTEPASPTPLPWTTVPGSLVQPAKDPALLLVTI